MTDGNRLPPRTPGPLGHNDAHDPSAAWTVIPPQGEIVTKARVKVQHAPKPLRHKPSRIQLRYSPQRSDMLGFTIKDSTPIDGSHILARDGDNFFVHGNNRIEVWCDGKDTTDSWGMSPLAIYRVWRVWEAPLGLDGRSRTGAYTKGGEANQYFSNDGSLKQSWADVPGQAMPRDRSQRKNQRHLIEFFVGVADRPDAGGLYFNVVIDETPDAFRVSMHKEKRFNADQWSTWFPTGFSFNEIGYEFRAAVAAPIWEPVATEDDLPVVVDYGGWHKFP
ncbi:MAG TPA: hypothetical protein VMR54_11125 [Thermoanaerobaculia bacterium]|nr:hypothetical protein [Thermoanaerobaculia bacterium]